jgi:spoIIIJ-associated protein
MRSVESEGNTIDEAIDNALRLLRLDRDAVEIEILENATKGVLGFGTKKARVRARERAKLDAVLSTSGTASASVATPTPSAPSVPAPRAAAPRDSPRPAPTPPGPRREPAAPVTGAEPATLTLRDTLADLLEQMGVECEVEIGTDPTGEAAVLRVSGRDGGIVIGRRGQTLDAIEHLMNRIALRESSSNPTRVRIDVEGYRERRQESLEQLARRLADKAKATGRVVTLNPMSPRDRRVIHITLQSDEDVTTWSQGEGHFRRLLIGPKDERRQGRQRTER